MLRVRFETLIVPYEIERKEKKIFIYQKNYRIVISTCFEHLPTLAGFILLAKFAEQRVGKGEL